MAFERSNLTTSLASGLLAAALATAASAAPPRVVALDPPPTPGNGAWAVGPDGLQEIRITFDQPVFATEDSVVLRSEFSGPIGFELESGRMATELVLTLDAPVTEDRLTMVLDGSIVNGGGERLDGEIADPDAFFLPSGDGVEGGQAAFRIGVLTGDVTRDGRVDDSDEFAMADALGDCVGDPNFNPRADLDGSGCVNVLDVAILQEGLGGEIPRLAGGNPTVIGVSPPPGSNLTAPLATVTITFSEAMTEDLFSPLSLLIETDAGDIVAPTLGVLGPAGDTATYVFQPALEPCGVFDVRISNALTDGSGRFLSPPPSPPMLTGSLPVAAPTLDELPEATNEPFIPVSGTAFGADQVRLSTSLGTVTTDVAIDGTFSTLVPLEQNFVNQVFARSVSVCGAVSAPVTEEVIQDEEAPELLVETPTDGSEVYATVVDVAGTISDTFSGFRGLAVSVNGTPASVNIGIGTNGTFFVPAVALNSPGVPTEIEIEASDELGNTTVRVITVTQLAPPVGEPTMEIESGNGQLGVVHVPLMDPIEVRVLQGDGSPFVDKLVRLYVSQNDGRLSLSPGFEGGGSIELDVFTNDEGIARAYWQLGAAAGVGNNRVTAESNDVFGSIVFCATGIPGAATQINVGTGNNQRVETGAEAPIPLEVWVNDSCNGIEGVAVTYTVVSGGGTVNGASEVVVITGPTGHAEVDFIAGTAPGNQRVVANFMANDFAPATFNAFALARDLTRPTRFTGLVVDNANRALGNTDVELKLEGEDAIQTVTDDAGRFRFDAVVGSGPGHLRVFGATATLLNGEPIDTGSFPKLEYEVVVVPNATNDLGMPVLLPPLDGRNDRTYSTTQETILEIAGVEGLRMIVTPGSMQIEDDNGMFVDAPDGTPMSLNQVHHDDIPMPMPDGVAPPFAWTLQPAGARFDPPIRIEYPNMSGLPAGAVAYFLSFNHDTADFEIVSGARVSDDASLIVSNDGDGISISGWGCNCPPYAVTGSCWGPCGGIGGSNGCGSEMGLSSLAPESFTIIGIPCIGTVNFSNGTDKACDNHDAGYAICGKDKCETDDEFLEDMCAECEAVFPSLLDLDCFTTCKAIAYIYYAAVKLGGGDSYSMAQQEAACCGCPIGVADQGPPSGEDPPLVGLPFADADGDLQPDTWESAVGLSPNDPDDAKIDSDGDKLINILEFIVQTDPFDTDSNDNGISDFDEMQMMQPDLGPSLGPGWTFSVNGQSVVIDAGSGFQIDNVSAPDLFGPGGPGTVPDFLSDDEYRVVGSREAESGTLWAYSEGFRIGQGQQVTIDELIFTDVPPPLPVSISITTSATVLLPGGTATPTVIGELPNGDLVDLSLPTDWTTYRSTNTDVIDIDVDIDANTVTIVAVGTGEAFVTASNDAAVSVKRIIVADEIDTTTITGIVQLEGGAPAVGAHVTTEFRGDGVADGSGAFSFELDVPGDIERISAIATLRKGKNTLVGVSDLVDIVAGETTDLGIIVVTDRVLWTSDEGGNWNDPTRWSTGEVPGPDDDVLIFRTETDPVITIRALDVNVRSLDSWERVNILAGSQLTVPEGIGIRADSRLDDGWIDGGELEISDGSFLEIGFGPTNRLTNVDVVGDLAIGGAWGNGRITVEGGLLHDGDLVLGQGGIAWGELNFTETSFYNGDVDIEFASDSPSNRIRTLTPGASLTIGPNVAMRGRAATIGSTATTLVAQGPIDSDELGQIAVFGTPIISSNVLQASGGNLYVDGLAGPAGDLDVSDGHRLIVDGSDYQLTDRVMVGDAATLWLRGTWMNETTITVNDGSLRLDGAFSIGDLGTIERTGGTVEIRGELDNTRKGLALDDMTGPIRLNGGSILGGTVTTTDTVPLEIGSLLGARLVGVTLDGRLDVGGPWGSGVVTVEQSLTINGTAELGASGSTGEIRTTGAVALNGDGVIRFAGDANGSRILPEGPGASLAIGSGLSIIGRTGIVGSSEASMAVLGTVLSNEPGTIALIGDGWTKSGVASATGGDLVLQGVAGNVGTVTVGPDRLAIIDGDDCTIDQPLSVMDDGVLWLRGTWTNAGGITVDDATLRLGGSFATADLGTIDRTGGTVELRGALDNGGSTLVLDEVSGAWRVAGGQIAGGTVRGESGSGLEFTGAVSNRITGVTLEGDHAVGGTWDDGRLTVDGVNTIDGTLVLGSAGSGGNWGQITGTAGASLVGDGTVVLASDSVDNRVAPATGTTFVIGPDLTVRGGAGTVGSANGGIVIAGTVRSDEPGTIIVRGTSLSVPGGLEIDGGSLSALGLGGAVGRIEAFGPGLLSVDGSDYVVNSRVAAANGGSTWVRGTWTINGQVDADDGTVRLYGVGTIGSAATFTGSGGVVELRGDLTGVSAIPLGPDSPLRLVDGRILDTSVSIPGSSALQVDDSDGNRLVGVSVKGDLAIGGAWGTGRVVLDPTSTVSGTARLGDGGTGRGTLLLESGSTASTPSIEMASDDTNIVTTAGTGSLTVADGTTVTATGASGAIGDPGRPLSVAGIVRSNDGGILTAYGELPVLTGTLDARTGGLVRAIGDWSCTGTARIDVGGRIDVFGDWAQSGAGRLNVQIGTAGGLDAGLLAVTGTCDLGGTLRVRLADGFRPSIGQVFTVLTCTARVDEFATYIGLDIGGGLELVPVFEDDAVRLVVQAAP